MDDDTPLSSAPVVRRRKVFFVPGFDPLGARRYRELYRKQGRQQAEWAGYALTVEGRPGKGPYGWTARASMDGVETEADIAFLEWADIVKGAMNVSIPRSYAQLARTLWLYLSSGALIALIRLRYIPMLIALYPAVILTLYLVVCGMIGWGLAEGLVLFGLSWLLAGPFGIAVFCALMLFLRRKDGKLYVYYLMSDYAYAASEGGRMPRDVAERVASFQTRIEAALASDVDEVLIVGHSSGAQIAVHLAARVTRPQNGPELALLTLGQVIPMVSFLPTARDLRGDLQRASLRPDLCWIDISAPSDGACFALADPVDVSGASPGKDVKRWPIVVSAKFSRALSERQHQELKGRFFTKHVQYLRAFERVQDYDYFAITAGPMTLRERFGWRGSSAGAVWDVMSPHRDME
ncbi:pimeloyl-ACP methyl ester carboxylesterase [Rubricella aquisinus]|uniref:Pimeloyl-ACP methyl ester carboxylesterase n=1 Tax=Rubricella aquisinus TaxID=2028108 RepID=A0A840X4R7_9RHOB|nr:hypothetical protein [Rubricella aquisinus]MBB5515677.1 pimeloyl-ACP methyl ester carboxylesterase [Rubricella aquisinus]